VMVPDGAGWRSANILRVPDTPRGMGFHVIRTGRIGSTCPWRCR
jgi:hypothetical protein